MAPYKNVAFAGLLAAGSAIALPINSHIENEKTTIVAAAHPIYGPLAWIIGTNPPLGGLNLWDKVKMEKAVKPHGAAEDPEGNYRYMMHSGGEMNVDQLKHRKPKMELDPNSYTPNPPKAGKKEVDGEVIHDVADLVVGRILNATATPIPADLEKLLEKMHYDPLTITDSLPPQETAATNATSSTGLVRAHKMDDEDYKNHEEPK